MNGADTHNTSIKTHKVSCVGQIVLRLLVIVTTIVATWLIFTSKETVVVYGITADASYKYSSAYKFYAVANIIACAFAVLSLLVVLIIGKRPFNPNKYFYLFVHDMILGVLLMAGCAAATAIGVVGKYGNNYTGWQKICDNFAKFCNRVILSIGFSYVSVFICLLLAIISANRSRQIQV